LAWNGGYSATAVMLSLTLVFVAAALGTINQLGIDDILQQVAVYLAISLPPALVVFWIGGLYQRNRSILRQA
jgi:hypothetical protein